MNGSLQGGLTQYFKNGGIKRLSHYKNNNREGQETTFNENGSIKEQGHYHLDVKIDIWTSHDIYGKQPEITDHGEYHGPDFIYF